MTPKRVSPRLEIAGIFLKGVMGSMIEDSVAPLRKKYDLDDIDPNKWYPAQKVVDFFDEVSRQGGMLDLVAIGMNIGKSMPFAPEVDSVKKALEITNEVVLRLWRGAEYPGRITMEFVTDRHLHLTFTNDPLPIDLIYGSFYSVIRKFAPEDADITVRRRVEGDTYIFDLRW
jgi:hypothetical protein